ncbi:MAG: class F sortase [Solirubrobacteraceae bacterium]
MSRPFSLVVLLVALALGGPSVAQAAEPPNQNDPCSRAGRNTCDTNGFGTYERYRYGLRWFGNFRRAIPDVTDSAFCIDLRFWYPSKAFDYRKRDIAGLRNKDGRKVSTTKIRRMSWALWNHGRSKSKREQAAVMLYVHGLMGDGAPGEVDPRAIGVKARHDRIARDARRYAGPYRIEVKAPTGATVGDRFSATIRVRAASGALVPRVPIDLKGSTGASGIPGKVTTSRKGIARVTLTATDVAGIQLKARTDALAATAPDLYVPTRGASARSGQRLVVPAKATVEAAASTRVSPARVKVTTSATPKTVLLGEPNNDAITIAGAPTGWKARVTVRLFGPARDPEAISCDGPPVAEVHYDAGPGESQAPPVTAPTAGWYGYQVIVPSTQSVIGTTTPCAVPEERFRVEVQPRVRTQVSDAVVTPGAQLRDRVWVEGVGTESITVNAQLWGPYPARDAMTCEGTPHWSGSFAAPGDGEYLTDPVGVTVPGYYTYREDTPAAGFARASQTACGEATETSIVRGTPRIVTQISKQDTAVGADVTDTAVVTGLGRLKADVKAELWGPYPSRDAMTCQGTPYWQGTFTADGDGSYVTAPVKLEQAGYYTYREEILASDAHDGFKTECGEAAETTIARAAPKVRTRVSSQVVRPGSRIFDRLTVSGLGKTPARVEAELFGPFATRAAIRCTGTPYWKGTVNVTGDGDYTTARVRVARAGFYTYRERIAGSEANRGAVTACGEESETALAQPLIPTDSAEPVDDLRDDATASADGSRPTSLRFDRLRIRATVAPVKIDTDEGILHVPNDIRRAGWWADGAAPGGKRGTTLIAGHVDSAKRGAGAFFRLGSARRGDTIRVRSADGRTRRYRVTSVRRVGKNRLPSSIFRRTGKRRLVLVTCGGPFDRRSGHYRDNVVVTATPR